MACVFMYCPAISYPRISSPVGYLNSFDSNATNAFDWLLLGMGPRSRQDARSTDGVLRRHDQDTGPGVAWREMACQPRYFSSRQQVLHSEPGLVLS